MNDRKTDVTENTGGNSTAKMFLMACIAIALVFVAIGPKAFSSDWVSSSDFHACIEISSSFIAIIAAVACLMYYFGLKSRFYLIIGLGFLVCGSEDLIHGIFGFKRLFADSGVDFSRFIPGTYVAGRMSLAIMIIAAPILRYMTKQAENIKREAIVYSSLALMLGGGLTALALTIDLPKFIYPDRLIPRPVDFVSAILFIVAFALIFKRFRHRRDIFSGSLLICILLNIGGQIYMSFSKQLFDVFFDIAHFANILSYCAPVLGIAIQSLQEMKISQRESLRSQQANQQLQSEITDRKQAENNLQATNQQLAANEQQLRAANQQLDTSNQQLRDSIEEIEQAKTEADESRQHAEQALAETERMNKLMTGREMRVIEMKREVNALLGELGREPQYKSVLEEETVVLSDKAE